MLILSLAAMPSLGGGQLCAAEGQKTCCSDEDIVAFQNQHILEHAFPKMEAVWFGQGDKPRNVSVCWENLTAASAADRGIVQRALNETWEAHSKVTFTGWAECVPNNLGIRIGMEDAASRPSHTDLLGNELDGIKNGMMLNFSFKNWNQPCSENGVKFHEMCIRSIAIHEFGHALGFAHEHNRDDTPSPCKFEYAPSGENGDNTTLTPWDPNSVMNYCFNMYRADFMLSKYDIIALQELYGAR
jgi:Astacin (Peptidase family M12A)